jgi:uncharacterized protein YceK
MKPNRSAMIAVLAAVLALCIAILLSGCASTGGRKEAAPKQESSQSSGTGATAAKQTGGSGAVSQQAQAVKASFSGGTRRAQAPGRETDSGVLSHYAANIKQGLARILPGALPGIDWNKALTVITGIVVISLIYGLGFGIGRLPARRRGAGRLGRGGQKGQRAEETIQKAA